MDKDAVGKVGDVVSTHLYAAVSAALKRIEAVLAKHGCPQGAEMADWLDAALAQQPAAQAAGLTDEVTREQIEAWASLAGIVGSGANGALTESNLVRLGDFAIAAREALLSRAAPSGEPVAMVVSQTGNDLRVGWLRPEACKVGDQLYAAPQPSAQQAEPSVPAMVAAHMQPAARKLFDAAMESPEAMRKAVSEINSHQAEQSAEEARGVDMDVLNALLDQINGRFSAAMDSAYAPGSDAFRRARRKFYESVETVRSTLALLAAPAAGTHDDMARGKTYGRVMMRAHALCPHGLSHPARMRWMAEYFMANYQGDAAGTGQEPIGYIDRKDVARLHTYKATIWPTTTEIDAVPVYTAPQVATGAGGAGVSHDYQRGYEDGQTDAQAATGAQGLDDVLAELDWCIGNGCYGPRTEKVLQRVRAILAQAAPSAASRDRADGFPILNAEHGDNAAKAERRKTAQTQYGCHHDESPM
ncbi:hypothetical protein EM868_09095 [Cupriavidus gilardii]|uniref:hypothetical protein n=1 Tax=Cupriavidus gilardii TaxID=82541 RepID=UPI001EE5DA13|nr:hypothetical protein [Cupriavidus gilardii]MCG5259789.1 hypothetical protein [Cupriavidus gilardii]MDF9429952.1 hypothetical protein [Cupriavidus gilardii]